MEKSLRPRVYSAQDAVLDPNTKPDGFLQKIVKYIPTEIVAAYVAIPSLLDQDKSKWIIFYILLGITPLYTWFFTKQPGLTKPIYQTITAPIAFTVWAFALGGPFEKLKEAWTEPKIGSVVMILTTILIPLAERIFVKNPT